MILQIYTDGGSKGNPGPGSIGIAFFLNGTKIDTYREDIGYVTNNEAEYQALVTALEKSKKQIVKSKDITKMQCFSDSRLMVNQVNGLFKVKNAKIREFIFKIRSLENEIGLPVSYIHIPREKNKIADSLVNNRD